MERLARAQDSTDLSESVEGPGDVDWLRASGAVAQRHGFALHLWRLIELGDGRALKPVMDGLLQMCGRMRHESDPFNTSSRVLLWMLKPTCQPCAGRGYDLIPGTPSLSDTACSSCGGTGQSVPQWGEHERDLYARVTALQQEAAAALARKLRG